MARISRWELDRLKREASKDAVLIHQRDGSVRAFDLQHVMGQMYLAQLDDALGRPRSSSAVLDALENATPESRRAVEELSSGDFYADLQPSESTGPVEDLSEP